MSKIAAYVVPLQARVVRPLADAADQRPWVPSRLCRGLRRIDGTCAINVPTNGVTTSRTSPPTVRNPIVARLYVKQAEKAEALGLAERRRQLLNGLSGRVLEIGAGTGTNFPHYPPGVTEVVAAEPEPFLRERAQRATALARVSVRMVDATAELLPFADGEFDAVVTSLVLCSVSDPLRALGELYRVVRPGGELRFNEHVLSETARVARVQRTADRLGWPRVSGGCHLGRDSEAMMRQAGFELTSLERYRFRIPPLDPPKPHIIGTARKPAMVEN
jgi:SAM-dependent methyltransferase